MRKVVSDKVQEIKSWIVRKLSPTAEIRRRPASNSSPWCRRRIINLIYSWMTLHWLGGRWTCMRNQQRIRTADRGPTANLHQHRHLLQLPQGREGGTLYQVWHSLPYSSAAVEKMISSEGDIPRGKRGPLHAWHGAAGVQGGRGGRRGLL